MLIAGFDLGRKCGYAILEEDGSRLRSGTWDLGRRSGRSIHEFETLLEGVFVEGVSAVGYEKVRRHRGVEAAHAYGGYEALLWKGCYICGIPEDWIVHITVQQIKRTATTLSSADKEAVEGATLQRWNYLPEDDNEADALWCAECVRRLLNGETL